MEVAIRYKFETEAQMIVGDSSRNVGCACVYGSARAK